MAAQKERVWLPQQGARLGVFVNEQEGAGLKRRGAREER